MRGSLESLDVSAFAEVPLERLCLETINPDVITEGYFGAPLESLMVVVPEKYDRRRAEQLCQNAWTGRKRNDTKSGSDRSRYVYAAGSDSETGCGCIAFGIWNSSGLSFLLQSMQEGSKAGKGRKRDMKQFLKRTIAGAACLAMALLFAGSASAKGDIFTQRQILADEDCICGVLFLGYVDGEKYLADDEEYRRQVLETSGYTEEFEFLTEIPSDRIVETDWGAELYCIYPRRADAVVAVNACGYEESEENGYDLVIGEMMFESRSGAPFLLRLQYQRYYE